jgi:heterodisulfide reductase subunit B2
MKPYAFFIGCQIPARLQQYEVSARAVLERLDVELKDFRQFNCCGYPMRNADEKAFLLSAAKNIALAERAGLDILTLCKCCFGSLKAADHLLKEDHEKRKEINRHLTSHKLAYGGTVQIKHLLSVLFHDIGVDTVGQAVTRPFKGLKIAAQNGCHALRPSRVTRFDDPLAPVMFDRLIKLTGAESVDWQMRLECCGAPLIGVNDGLSASLMQRKIDDAETAGARYLCTACPYCQLQFDAVQETTISGRGKTHMLPSILFPQLLGVSMGVPKIKLGFEMNRLDISGVDSFLKEE